MIIERKGNIFTTKCQTIVNTVNCVGVMGAGIAYEFRLRNPEMYERYRELCTEEQIDIGKLWTYTLKGEQCNYEKVLNFPTKSHWKFPSKEEYLHLGLQNFITTYRKRGITSAAFPMLGADKGGIPKERAVEIMESYLSKCDIDIEIWEFDPTAKDDLYEDFKSIFNELDDHTIKTESKIRSDILVKIRSAMERDDINSLSGLLRVKGVGDATLEKLFRYISSYKRKNISLFNYEGAVL